MMDTDSKIPSQTTNIYWIYSNSEGYQFKKPALERDSGKWLIFEHISEVDGTWKKIDEAILDGLLGPSAKVSTAKPNPNALDKNIKVICVYTEDFNDKNDINRIANAIRHLGIENKLIYKLDRDVGKYSKDGFTKLSKEVRFSKKYEEVVAWLVNQSNGKYIHLLGRTDKGTNRYRFSRLDMPKDTFNKKVIRLQKLGFIFEKRNEIKEEEVIFLT